MQFAHRLLLNYRKTLLDDTAVRTAIYVAGALVHVARTNCTAYAGTVITAPPEQSAHLQTLFELVDRKHIVYVFIHRLHFQVFIPELLFVFHDRWFW
jgi:hypothetical protein